MSQTGRCALARFLTSQPHFIPRSSTVNSHNKLAFRQQLSVNNFHASTTSEMSTALSFRDNGTPDYSGPPTQEKKNAFWELFLAKPPSSNEDNPREFRALINRASTEAEMCVAALIIESARMFHGTQELMTCRYGIQKGKRKLEKKMLRMVTEICGSVHDEKYDRLYQEHFPFGPMPQGRLYARLYDLNNLIGCRGRNPQRSRRSWVLGHGRR